MSSKLLAIDPGDKQSAYVLMEGYKPVDFDILPNAQLLERFYSDGYNLYDLAIEMIANMGMPAVGATLFETAFWIGRYWEASDSPLRKKIYRRDEKLNLCGSMRAKDANIKQALIDRFGDVGKKKTPGPLYGFKKDIWAAYAVGVTYMDVLHGDYEIREV